MGRYISLIHSDLKDIKLFPKRVADLDTLAYGLCKQTRLLSIEPRDKISYSSVYPPADFFINLPTDNFLMEGRVLFEILPHGKLRWIR